MSETRPRNPQQRRRRSGRRPRSGGGRRQPPAPLQSSVAFLFPGQGSQFVGMGQALAQAYPVAAKVFAQADEILGFPISRLCFEGPDTELRRTANAQPALLCCSIAALRVVEQNNVKPGLLAGHSLGEFSAWVASGALEFADALQLVRKRGELMEAAAREQPGSMMAVLGIEEKSLKRLISGLRGVVVPANFNCPGQIVVSGEEAALRALRERVIEEKGRAIPLRVSGAFHSPLMKESAKLFDKEVGRLKISPARLPVVCNVEAKPVTSPEAIRRAISRQMTGAVLWEASIRSMAQAGIKRFLEVGPGEVLCGLVRRTLENADIEPVGEPEQLQKVIAPREENLSPAGPPAAEIDASENTDEPEETENHGS